MENMCWLSLNGERKGCEGIFTVLASGNFDFTESECLDRTIKSCTLVVLSFTLSSHLSLCSHAHRCLRMLVFWVRNALGNSGAFLEKHVCWVGLSGTSCCWEGFDDGKMRFCLMGHLEACGLSWAFFHGKASLWDGLSAGVSSVFGLRAF